MRLCPKCHRLINDSDIFCTYCGTQLKKLCPHCGRYVNIGVNFCIHCGYSFIRFNSRMNSYNNTKASGSVSVSNSVAKSVSALVSSSVSSSIVSRASASYSSEAQFQSILASQQSSEHSKSNYDSNGAQLLNESSIVNTSSQVTSSEVISKITTAISSVDSYQQTRISKISQSHMGTSTVLNNNKALLQQAYSTRYPERKLPRTYRLVNFYNVSSYSLDNELKLINKMLNGLNCGHDMLEKPIWANYYSHIYQNFINEVKGAEGEHWACNNLEHNHYFPYAHNVNIPFNYQKYYKKAYFNACQSREKYFHKDNHNKSKQYNKKAQYLYKCCKHSQKFPENNSNQIDILYINSYGIFIFEVKTFRHQKIWINQHGQIEWLNSNGHRGSQNDPFEIGSLTIKQQLKLHKKAILLVLKKSQASLSFSHREWDKIKHNIYGILVYIKAPKSAHGKIGVYDYDRGRCNYSRELHIPVVDQNHCYQAVRDCSKQYIFTDEMVDKLRKSIIPKYEKGFELPIFQRNNIKSLNMVLDYKNKLNCIYKLLRHLCYSKKILKYIIPKRPYQYYLIKRSQKYHQLHNHYLLANYWYRDRWHYKWHLIKGKARYRHNIQYWHHINTKRYHHYCKLYQEFYE